MSDPRSPGGGIQRDEVIRNSALSFLACAQAASGESSQDARDLNQPERLVPPGLKALCDAYSRLYPDQTNPLQVTTRLKYWLGGQDPLDYISMYWNNGKPEENVPPHWHYVSFGLSDLHGDGRVHVPPDRVLLAAGVGGAGCAVGTGGAGGERPLSGLGLELTFRLEAPPLAPPPLWPAALLQALARYLFTTGNKFVPGDHISWHCALDGSASRVRHLLVAADPQLPAALDTPHGLLGFIQIVGCTGRELRAAQRGSGFDVLKLMSEDPNCGGSWLVTRMRRRASARRVRAGSAGAGGDGPAQLAGVSARMRWEPWTPPAPPAPAIADTDTGTGSSAPQPTLEAQTSPQLSSSVERQIKETLQRGLSCMSTERSGPEGHTGMSTDSFGMSSIERALPQVPELMQGSWRSDGGYGREGGVGAGEGVERLAGVHVALNAEGAALLPLALAGRVLRGTHFTWRCGPRAATLLAPSVAGARASPAHPYVAQGLWLQMVIPEELARDMSRQVLKLSKLAETDSESDSEHEGDKKPPTLPLIFTWPKFNLKISVLPDHEV